MFRPHETESTSKKEWDCPVSATEALAFLRSLPTADDRALAARPLLDLLKAPGNTAVAGWSILIQLIQALEPDLPLRTILDIARSQETRANGDITGNDLDSLPSLSPMLRETIPGRRRRPAPASPSSDDQALGAAGGACHYHTVDTDCVVWHT